MIKIEEHLSKQYSQTGDLLLHCSRWETQLLWSNAPDRTSPYFSIAPDGRPNSSDPLLPTEPVPTSPLLPTERVPTSPYPMVSLNHEAPRSNTHYPSFLICPKPTIEMLFTRTKLIIWFFFKRKYSFLMRIFLMVNYFKKIIAF
jgi:hypothetical protein